MSKPILKNYDSGLLLIDQYCQAAPFSRPVGRQKEGSKPTYGSEKFPERTTCKVKKHFD